jgi:hephaestin
MCSDQDFDEVTRVYTEKGRHRIGTKYTKAVYREYATNGLFDELRWGDQSRFNPASEHLGILGPVIKAVVGETIEIVFRNNLRADANLVAFGGALAPSKIEALNDRQKKAGSSDNHVVVPGGEVRITIPVSAAAGPVDGSKQNSVAYVYGSDVNFVADVNSGLVGAFIIHAQDGGPRWASPTGVHREFVTLLSTFDENLSRYAEMNILKYAEDGDTVDRMDPEFKASNRMHSLNGYLHCNGPAAVAKQFQNVRWYMLSVGDSHDLHGPSVSGYTFSTSQDAAMHQVALLAPGMARSVDLNVDRWGKWLVKDAVVDNQRAGMEMFFEVTAVLHPGA